MACSTQRDARLQALDAAFLKLADPEHAAFHQAYHKSAMAFLGLKVPDLRRAVKLHVPMRPSLERAEALDLATQLWSSATHEHRTAALLVIERVARDLRQTDLPLLKRWTKGCDGWALLDHLAVHVLGAWAAERGDPAFRTVRDWSRDRYLWTRRASVLVHIGSTRAKHDLRPEAWSTFEELLEERDFFLRKAIGWTLREACKREPERVAEFLLTNASRVSGLTRREGARKLPKSLREEVLGSA